MDRMTREIKQGVGNNRYPTLTRIKIGKGICAWALLPFNASIWMFPIGAIMQIPITPSLWAKDKLRNFKERLRLL